MGKVYLRYSYEQSGIQSTILDTKQFYLVLLPTSASCVADPIFISMDTNSEKEIGICDLIKMPSNYDCDVLDGSFIFPSELSKYFTQSTKGNKLLLKTGSIELKKVLVPVEATLTTGISLNCNIEWEIKTKDKSIDNPL